MHDSVLSNQLKSPIRSCIIPRKVITQQGWNYKCQHYTVNAVTGRVSLRHGDCHSGCSLQCNNCRITRDGRLTISGDAQEKVICHRRLH